MKCSIHKIKEYINVDISIIAMNEETATKMCEEMAKLIGTHVSDTWKIEITNQAPAKDLQERYYCTITYEIESKKIEQEIDGGFSREELKKMKRIAEFLNANKFGKGIGAAFGEGNAS